MQADHKIDQCVLGTPDKPDYLEHICGAGVDPDFDQLISALAHINRQKPKPLVDTIMYWRKAKGDQAMKAKEKLNNVGAVALYLVATLIRFSLGPQIQRQGGFQGVLQNRRICRLQT